MSTAAINSPFAPPTRQRQNLNSVLAAAAILALGIVAVIWAQWKLKIVIQKTPTPLQQPLFTIPRTLGHWQTPTGAVDEKLSTEVVQTLGTTHYLLREYVNTHWPVGSPGSTIKLNINYYPTAFATPHVPNVCWQGAGLKMQRINTITIPDVPHDNGKVTNIPLRFLSFAIPEGGSGDMPSLGNISGEGADGEYLNTGYTFQVDGQYVPDPAQVSELFWQAQSKYGYDAKIEVDVLGSTTREQAKRAIISFLRAALPDIERTLPNWQKLNASEKKSPATATRP